MSPDPVDLSAPTADGPWEGNLLARQLLDSASEGIVVYDRELRYRVWNRAMEVRTGAPAASVYGRVCHEIFPHLRDAGLVPYLERALAGDAGRTPEYRYWSPYSHVEGWAQARVEPLRDATGAVVGVLSHIEDVTARRRAAEAAERNESQFRTIIESAGDVVLILDGAGVARYASPALTPVLGWTVGDVLGENPLARIHPEDREAVRTMFGAMIAEPGATHRVQYRARHADGSWRTLLSTARNLLDDRSVQGIVVTSRDVTDWVDLQARLLLSQRIEAVGRLAGGVAHDFNNLLTVIRGNAQLLLGDPTSGAATRAELAEIAQAADRASTLTRQLLAFSRQQVLQPRVLDLGDILHELWPLLQRLVGEAIVLERRVAPSTGLVRADPAQVEQVLLNLVVNARDAMPHGGTVSIETTDVAVDEAFAEQHAPMPAGSYVRLSVLDTGVGMDETTLARAFDPFFTTKPLGQGTGMGLPTVYGIVKQSGGYLWPESVPGEGTTFNIYLPRSAESARITPSGTPVREPRRGTETILIAEDEQMVRTLTRRTLERAGYRVHEAGDGVEALAVARAIGDALDLLITDIVMPAMGGRELAARLRVEHPGLRILFMSGYTHEREAHLSAGEGISNFLHKPFSLDELRGRVRQMLDHAATRA